MKLRNGFVSNSSSSSFIIVFPKHIGSAENMGKLLFRGDWEDKAFIKLYDDTVTLKDIADRVYKDYCEAKKHTADELRTSLINELEYKLHSFYVHNIHDIFQLNQEHLSKELVDIILEEYKFHENNHVQSDKKNQKEYWAEYNKISERKSAIINKDAVAEANSLLKTHSEYTILCLEYSDNDGVLQTTIEHGDVFKNLVSQRISKH